MTKDRVWFLIGSLQVGGANRTLVDLAKGLDSSRYDLTIWTLLDHNPLADELDSTITHRSLDVRSKADLISVVRFLLAVRRERPDILQSFLFFDNILARIAGLTSPGTRVISGVRAVPEEPKPHRELVEKTTIRFADRIVSNSEAGAELVTRRGADPERVEVIPNGRELSEYANATASDDLRERLRVPNDARLVGTVGRLTERKGGYDLLEAWPGVRSRNPDAHLLFVGDGPERSGLESRAAELDCTDSVTFAGTRQDVPELLDTMDVFVFPSHYEGLPGALIEAMAAGLPVVATRAAGNVELINNQETGLLVPVREPDILMQAIDTLLSDSELANQLSITAAESAQQRFSLETMVNRFDALYQELLETGD